MKKLFLYIILLCGVALQTHAQLNPVFVQKLDTTFDSLCKKYNLKGASASVMVPGHGQWERAYGVSHDAVPITTDMYMGIGSNTKTYTAVLMLKLQEQGKLDLDDTIGKWIQHPNITGSITIRQLLNHTSGLYSYTNNSDINNYIVPDFTKIWPPDSVLNLVKPPVAAPGGAWDYCNTNFLVAGLIIRDVMSQPVEKTLRDEILTPYGLNETFFFPHEMPAGTMPHCWSNVLSTGNAMEDMTAKYNYSQNAFLSLAYTAGGMMTTARDNALFWKKLVNGEILNAASMAELQTYVSIDLATKYGLGVFHYPYFNGRPALSHGGTNYGFINENIADKVSGVSISLLTNQDSIGNNILLSGIIKELHKITIQHTGVADAVNIGNGIEIYPNPAQSYITIKIDNVKNAGMVLYDVLGRVALKQTLKNGENILDISGLASGTYIARIHSNENMTSTHRIVKQ